MTYQPNNYTGNGTNRLFTVSFPYLSQADVVVTVNGTLLTQGINYSFVSPSQIQTTVAPANGAEVQISRSTDTDDINAVFQSGSAIAGDELNVNFRQTLFVAQEILSKSAEAVEIAEDAANAEANAAEALATANGIAAAANSALSTANSALSTANSANLTADGIASTANTALSNSIAASNAAASALTTANSISATASSALSAANTAVSTANTASSNATAALANTIPAGAVMYVAANSPPSGWLRANGAAVSRVAYATLFSVIGTIWGSGDGSTTFNLPDLRGTFLRGFDDGRGLDVGRNFATFQSSANLAHSHGVNDSGHGHAVYDPGHAHNFSYPVPGSIPDTDRGIGNSSAFSLDTPIIPNTAGTVTGISIYASITGISIQANGGSEARPANNALLAIIKF